MDHGRHTYLTFRNILIYVVLLWSGMTVNAQSGKGSFAGRVVDKDTKQPVGYAAVRLLTLPDSTFLAGVATTDDGKFRIPVVWPKDKKLLLEISFIGYTTFLNLFLLHSEVLRRTWVILHYFPMAFCWAKR